MPIRTGRVIGVKTDFSLGNNGNVIPFGDLYARVMHSGSSGVNNKGFMLFNKIGLRSGYFYLWAGASANTEEKEKKNYD
jgi:hypothetical protein